jgi:CoA:oxalate CoA-transferase
MVMDIEHPGHGLVRMLGFPMKFSRASCTVRRPAPALGQHTDEVLMELGFSEVQCREFRNGGVV